MIPRSAHTSQSIEQCSIDCALYASDGEGCAMYGSHDVAAEQCRLTSITGNVPPLFHCFDEYPFFIIHRILAQ